MTLPVRSLSAACAGVLLAACATTSPMTQPPTAKASVPPSPHTSALLTAGAEVFTQACQKDLGRAREGMALLGKPAELTTAGKGTLAVFDAVQAALLNAGARASVARNSHPDAAMRAAADSCEQEVEKLSTSLGLDRSVYEALAAVNLSDVDGATRTWVERTLRDMRRAGVDRDEKTRAQIEALNAELTLLGQEFGNNIRTDVRSVSLTPAALEGLPEDYRRAHPPGADGKVTVTSDYPDYLPFMTYARDGKAREALWRAYRQRAHPKNLDVLSKLISKRHQLATLLGYPTWAAYVTETKMIKTAEKAAEFIDTVSKAAEGPAKREYALLLALKQKDDPRATRLEPWDQDFYEDRYKAQALGFDSQSARPYFEYANVLAGVLDVTSTMFGIRYQKVENLKLWHDDVVSYDVFDGAGLRGRIYLDMHPRADKYKHAAQFNLAVGQAGKAYAEGVLMCNFPKPSAEPALMQPREVETFFHEFGHLLHHILGGNQTWAAQSGIRTEWDFVEAPSMLLQEWAQLPEPLARFAKHHQTGQDIPAELVKRMVAAKEFGKGLYTRRQMFLSAVSLGYYNRAPGFDTTAVARELQPAFEPFRKEFAEDTYFQLSFGHLDGYSAIYYTYVWSSVIAQDLKTVFAQEGFLNPSPAGRYRSAILEAGGSKDAAVLVQDFLGREFSFEAYERWLNSEPLVKTQDAGPTGQR